MTHIVHKFQTWILQKIFRSMIRQGPNHAAHITHIYRVLWNECRDEFTEDTNTGLRLFLEECHAFSMPPKLNQRMIDELGAKALYNSRIQN